MTLRELVLNAEAELGQSPHPERARLDAEGLLLHLIGHDRAWLLAHWNDVLHQESERRFKGLVARRRAGEPVQYITGLTEFFRLPFIVKPDVLIPRPETEHLVEEVIHLAANFKDEKISIADIGTGSGAIAIALAHTLPKARITATDISSSSLKIARQNAGQNHVSDRIEFLEGDLLAPILGRSFQIIASNPPYVPTRDRESLSVEVRQHEPHVALFAEDNGLAIYRRLIPDTHALLAPGGSLVLEIGYGQQQDIERLLSASGYTGVYFVNDYQGIPRVAAACKSS